MDSIVETLVNLQDVLIKENSSLKTLTSEKTKVDNALRNLVSAIEQGIISNTTNKRLHELEKQQEDLERQIIIERSKATVKLTANEIREFYEQALALEPKMLVNFLIKEIVLYNDRIEVFVNNPLKVSPDDSQGFSLYKGVATLHHRPKNKQRIENVKMKIEIYIG